MHPLDRTARLAGFLYLLLVITGFYTLMYVPGKLFVPGDSAATASNILAHQSLFRAYIAIEFLSELFFIATVLALSQLLKSAGQRLAILMVLLVLLDAPLAFAGVANDIAALSFLRGGDFLAAFDPAQQRAVAMLLLKLNDHATLVSQMFWGLWLLPLGWLACRSGFVPRLLGVWLIINGLAYAVLSVMGLLWPGYPEIVSTIATPILLGEVAFTLWLLIAGVRVPALVAAVSP